MDFCSLFIALGLVVWQPTPNPPKMTKQIKDMKLCLIDGKLKLLIPFPKPKIKMDVQMSFKEIVKARKK